MRKDYFKNLTSSEGLSDVFGELTFPYVKRKDIKVLDLPQIRSSKDVYDYIMPVYNAIEEEREVFYVIYLNRTNRVVGRWLASIGSLFGTVVPVDMILGRALLLQAHGFVTVHNHPSGNIHPSKTDIEVAKKLKEAALIFDISFLDNIIISNDNDRYYSFADERIL